MAAGHRYVELSAAAIRMMMGRRNGATELFGAKFLLEAMTEIICDLFVVRVKIEM